MSIIHKPKHLPVFHHIAKNAGTYTLSWMQMLCRRYHILRGDNVPQQGWTASRIRRCLIELSEGNQLTVVYYTPTDLSGDPCWVMKNSDCTNPDGSLDGHKLAQAQIDFVNQRFPSEDGSTNHIPLDLFIEFVKNKEIEPFSISVDPMHWGGIQQLNSFGWLSAEEAIQKIIQTCEREKAINFTLLRDPYERAASLFYYLKSEDSSHEPNHNCLESEHFEQFLLSRELEDSWFLRNLIGLNWNEEIQQEHFDLACSKYLQHFAISDISGVDNLIDSVFYDSYGIRQTDVEDRVVQANISKNSTTKKIKIPFYGLDLTTQQTFLDRTYWDRKLWERYCKNVDIS